LFHYNNGGEKQLYLLGLQIGNEVDFLKKLFKKFEVKITCKSSLFIMYSLNL